MIYNDITVRFCGIAGDGIVTCGKVMAGACAEKGLSLIVNDNFSAEIRGMGKSTTDIRFSSHDVLSMGDGIDVLIALADTESIAELKDLKPGGFVLYADHSQSGVETPHPILAHIPEGINSYGIPLKPLSEQATNSTMARNIVAIGGFTYLLSLPPEPFLKLIAAKLGKKGNAVVEMNTKAFNLGRDFCSDNFGQPHAKLDLSDDLKPKSLVTGNQSIARGALDCGLSFFAGYPITPATRIMEIVAEELPKLGGWMLQAEDEIAAAGAVMGGWFAGKRSMTATSGPGLALMAEMLNMGVMAEIPMVIVDVQRGGPSTGLPTKVEQADLNGALYGSPGDSPRIVIAPSSGRECYTGIQLAFDLAEKYQTPVIVLSDLFLANRTVSAELKPEVDRNRSTRIRPDKNKLDDYRRYANTDSGVSPWMVPGEKGAYYTVTGLEHSEYGNPNFDADVHQSMSDKRFRKFESMKAELPAPIIRGDLDAAIGLTCWGSTLGSIEEAMEMAREKGVKSKLIQSIMINPQPEEQLQAFFDSCERIIIPEMNQQGQYASLLKSRYGIRPIEMHFAGVNPVSPKQISQKIIEVHHELTNKAPCPASA